MISKPAVLRERLVSLPPMCASARLTRPVPVTGAPGRSGLALCRSLLADGIPVVPVVRNSAKWEAEGLAGTPRQADLRAPDALYAALAGATRIASCAHARYTPAIIAAAPAEALLVAP